MYPDPWRRSNNPQDNASKFKETNGKPGAEGDLRAKLIACCKTTDHAAAVHITVKFTSNSKNKELKTVVDGELQQLQRAAKNREGEDKGDLSDDGAWEFHRWKETKPGQFEKDDSIACGKKLKVEYGDDKSVTWKFSCDIDCVDKETAKQVCTSKGTVSIHSNQALSIKLPEVIFVKWNVSGKDGDCKTLTGCTAKIELAQTAAQGDQPYFGPNHAKGSNEDIPPDKDNDENCTQETAEEQTGDKDCP